MIRFSHGAATSVGRVRQVNEDRFLAVPPLFVVADGMGGHGSGDVASTIAIAEMSACAALRPLFKEAVLTALEHANRNIIEQDSRMGTTVTGLAGLETAGGDHLMVFNVGDSRVYRLAGHHLEQLTVDHSEVQELVVAGVLTPEQARTHPRRNVVTAIPIAAATQGNGERYQQVPRYRGVQPHGNSLGRRAFRFLLGSHTESPELEWPMNSSSNIIQTNAIDQLFFLIAHVYATGNRQLRTGRGPHRSVP